MRTTTATSLTSFLANESSCSSACRIFLRLVATPICAALFLILQSVGAPITWERTYYAPPAAGNNNWSGLNAVVYGNGLFVAVGSDIAISTNGSHWERFDSPTVVELWNVIYAAGKFVAVGGAYHHRSSQGGMSAIVVSEDGIHWTKVLEEKIQGDESDPNGFRTLFLADVAWIGNQYVAVGNGVGKMVLSSTNGVVWQHVSTSVQLYCNSIAYGQGQGVIVGSGTLRSLDGLVWTPSSPELLLQKVRFGLDRFVAGGGGVMLSSSDGVTWSTDYQHGDSTFDGIAFGESSAVSVGGNDNRTTLLAAGPDLQWSPQDMSGVLPPSPPNGWVPPGLHDVAFGAGYFVAVGDWHLILTGNEPPLQPVLSGSRLAPNGAFEFHFSAQTNHAYRIEASEDMFTWQVITNLVNQSGKVNFTDIPTASAKFYRVVLE